MKETWRWFGPDDPVSLQDIAQAGATGIVTALHHLPAGAIWSEREISLRNKEILLSKSSIDVDLKWNVVESLPVSEDIKRQSGDWRNHIKNYCISLENLAAAGISTICYNFIHKIFTARFDITSLSVLCLSKLHEVITRSIVTSVNPKSPSASKFAGF